MARNWIVVGLVCLALAGAGIAVAVVTMSGDEARDTRAALTTTAPATTRSPTTTSAGPPTTTTPDGAITPTTTATPPRAPPPAPAGDCGAEAGAIRAAIDAGLAGAAGAELVECRLAAADPSWALARLDARPGASFEPIRVLLQGGGGAWSIVDTGGADVGCGKAPQQVLVDVGTFCASTGGGSR